MHNKNIENLCFHETLPHKKGLKRKHFIIFSIIIIFLFTFPFVLHTYEHTNELVDLNRITTSFNQSDDLSKD